MPETVATPYEPMSKYLPLSILIAVSLQGCATLFQDECETLDWYGIGYQDGLQGQLPRSVAEYHQACAERDVTPELARYTQGRDQGLKQFCRPGNGFRLGLRGAHYNGACLAEAEEAFLPAYEQGKEILASEVQIRRLDEILRVNTSELNNLTASVQRKEVELIAHDTDPKRRALLLLEMHDLQETVTMVENEIDGIETALEEEGRHLQHLRESNPYR
jgi:hypothetical protein